MDAVLPRAGAGIRPSKVRAVPGPIQGGPGNCRIREDLQPAGGSPCGGATPIASASVNASCAAARGERAIDQTARAKRPDRPPLEGVNRR
jgi:hypothetical protein